MSEYMRLVMNYNETFHQMNENNSKSGICEQFMPIVRTAYKKGFPLSLISVTIISMLFLFSIVIAFIIYLFIRLKRRDQKIEMELDKIHSDFDNEFDQDNEIENRYEDTNDNINDEYKYQNEENSGGNALYLEITDTHEEPYLEMKAYL